MHGGEERRLGRNGDGTVGVLLVLPDFLQFLEARHFLAGVSCGVKESNCVIFREF